MRLHPSELPAFTGNPFFANADATRSTRFLVGVLLVLGFSGCGGSQPAVTGNSNSDSNVTVSQVRVGTTAVTTWHNDNQRTGVNPSETSLTTANVNSSTFGKIGTLPVQGFPMAQPLYVPNVSMGSNALHNALFVATEHNQVYAFDVDSQKLLWHTDFLGASGNVTTIPYQDVNCDDLLYEIGITGTPVIDRVTNSMYLVARTKEVTNGQVQYVQRLHSLDLATGLDKTTPLVITSPPPDTLGNVGSTPFDPLTNNQRSALLLAGGQVFVAWASHCDYGGYHGWLMSFDKTTLQPAGYWSPSPVAGGGGIWMGAGGPAVDANGKIYLATGNAFGAIIGGYNYPESAVRLNWQSSSGLTPEDSFTPYNYEYLDSLDLDFGSNAATLLPDQPGSAHPHLLLVGGKQGVAYLIDRDKMGGWQQNNDSQAVQTFSVGGKLFGSFGFWNNHVYVAASNDSLRSFPYDPVAQQVETVASSATALVTDFRGATPAITSNGTGEGIVWILNPDVSLGYTWVLHAYDATDLTKELYNSEMLPTRDRAGLWLKFITPTVADGMVFVGAQNEIDVYGLLQN